MTVNGALCVDTMNDLERGWLLISSKRVDDAVCVQMVNDLERDFKQ